MATFPGKDWARIDPDAADMDPTQIDGLLSWLRARAGADSPCRVVVVRRGGVVFEWNHNVAPDDRLRLASAAKSIFSCILGILIHEGTIPSADARVADFYPEMMDVPEGFGPKAGRYAFEANREITFRQLISNTSGYMKPGEEPGEVFNYQTYGMNILTHAMAKLHGLYSVDDPEGSPGLQPLIESRLGAPIGVQWAYHSANFDLQPHARLAVFGYYDGVQSTALDMARLGWLWRNWGRWEGDQVVPEAWLREATQTAPAIRAHCSPEQWKYGYGFWTNDHAQLWPSLPRDSFAASGAGSQHIWVCPSLDLVVAQSPGLWQDQAENDDGLLRKVVDACRAG
ncbi:MAG: serine hydrolase [Caldilineaceae bacterium]|nr:serine hydrolase [Caldilineaceae bacterium]